MNLRVICLVVLAASCGGGAGSRDGTPLAGATRDAGFPEGDTALPALVDNCDGTHEFLAIPPEADIVFSAGIYAPSSGIENPAEVYALDLEEQRTFRVTCSNRLEPTCAYAGPSVSPDRRRMVVMRGCADTNGNGHVDNMDEREIAIIDLSADSVVTLPGLSAANSPHWSARDEIVFAANEPGSVNTDVYKVAPDGSPPVNLTSTPALIENDPAWSHGGDSIVFAKGAFVAPAGAPAGAVAAVVDLWVMNADGTEARKVVSFDGDPACPEYSDHYCRGMPADPEFLPGDDRLVFERLLSVTENQGSGRFNIFTSSASGLDVNVVNVTNDPTAYQAMPAGAARGILFHEVDTTKPCYGLVLVRESGIGRTVVVDGSAWTYYVGNGHWLP